MNSKDIIEKKKNILYHLSKRQLKEAFKLLNNLSANAQDWKVAETLTELETNYKFMLHYLFEGTEDSEREKVYKNLLRSLYEITDDITDELLKMESTNIFYERLRINDLKVFVSIDNFQTQFKDIYESLSLISLLEDGEEKEIKSKELHVKKERVASEMFDSIFISPRATESVYNDYLSFITSSEIDFSEKCLFISAITLNLCHRFDAKKMQILMDAVNLNDIQVRARAIVGLIIIMQMYDIRWNFYTELQNQLEVLTENTDFKKTVLQVIIQLIRSRETEKISKKITEEIIPEMMRFNHLAGKKLNIEELLGDADLSEKNPEWKKELDESGLADKLQEYSNLQMEGADVFHSTFASLKSFPFFSDISNWFLPFDTNYSQISSIFGTGQNSNLLKTAIVDSSHMCNSDKYSFCLSLLQIPSSQREMMLGKMGAESEELKQLQKEAAEMNANINEEIISNQYIQDLYRFFKLNPHKNNFFDIFKLKLNFHDKKSIAPLISDTDSLKKIALYCFEKNYFKEALSIFDLLIAKSVDSGDIWQKIGYCKQMLDDYDGALDAYLHADLITPNNSWILRRIAHIYRSIKKPESAIEYYQKTLTLTPDNLSLELNIGHCYLELNEYEKALNSYFKVELLDTKNGSKALRPIAWTAFLLHKFELSQKYYKRILENKPTIHDYLNVGHLELCSGQMNKAIEYYKQAAFKEEDFSQFISLFEMDKDVLISFGVKTILFPFIYDQIQYGLNK